MVQHIRPRYQSNKLITIHDRRIRLHAQHRDQVVNAFGSIEFDKCRLHCIFDRRSHEIRATVNELNDRIFGDHTDQFTYEPRGVATAIPAALERLLRETAGRRGAAAVLASDGGTNTGALDPEPVAAAFKARGIPIYTLCVGSDESTPSTRDVGAGSISAPKSVGRGASSL